jgi:hypothetical protein
MHHQKALHKPYFSHIQTLWIHAEEFANKVVVSLYRLNRMDVAIF